MMEYKGYTAKVEFDNDAGLLHGQVLNIRDVITFQATSVDELREEFKNSVDDYLEFCAERGEQPEKAYSGKFVIRVDPAVHRDIAVAADRAGQSINTWVVSALVSAVRPAFTAVAVPDMSVSHDHPWLTNFRFVNKSVVSSAVRGIKVAPGGVSVTDLSSVEKTLHIAPKDALWAEPFPVNTKEICHVS